MAKTLLGDHRTGKHRFVKLDAAFKKFEAAKFLASSDRERSVQVNAVLLDLIQKEPEPCFLLYAVLEFIERVEKEKILSHYTFTSFELWLNQFSNLSFEENARIRGKIAGKWIPRGEYQKLFPIGMGKVYEGTHFVTAHKSPDLDTTVASFWGWVDAFAARVGDGLHIWNVPGGPPPQIEIDLIFRDVFGDAVFSHLAKTRTVLNLTGNDLMTQEGLQRVNLEDSIASIDHDRNNKAVIIVDPSGFYLGDWRSIDVEGVRQVIISLSSCIRWFENHLHLKLISLFAKKDLHWDMVAPQLKAIFTLKIKECEPALGFSFKEKKNVQAFILQVLGLEEGLESTFETLGRHLARLGKIPFEGMSQILEAMKPLFDAKGRLVEDRPKIFTFLENAIHFLHEEIIKIRERLEKLDIALRTKTEVFEHQPTFVTVRSDVEEIRSKMGSYLSLTVAYPDKEKFFPVGTIYSSELRKSTLGTVSLRDFCNSEEMGIPSYLEVISVIDHHKSSLSTTAAPMAMIADVQSSNTLVAKLAFEINDRYSLGGQSPSKIDEELRKAADSPLSHRILSRLLSRRQAAYSNLPFYIHPERERIEYLHFLYAILEDTDLLSKVSAADLDCVAALLNRLKSLSLKAETEIIDLGDLAKDKSFLKKGAQRILQNDDMYSLYKKVYAFKEKEVERNLELAASGKSSAIFADTKEQNGCCRVGQTKLFANNFPLFKQHADAIRRVFLAAAKNAFQEKPQIDLHIHMISTIVSAEEVHHGKTASYSHKDELWIWIPEGDLPVEHLKAFLNHFKNSPGLENNPPGGGLEVEFLGANAADLALIFKESFFDIPHKSSNKKLPIAVLRYKAGSLNSRKAMVTPFLPTLS
jgi:hypothetical protein